jgi:hypothetical protein
MGSVHVIQAKAPGMEGRGRMKPEKRRKKKVRTPATAAVTVREGHR